MERRKKILDESGNPLKDLLPTVYETSLDEEVKLLGNYTGLKSNICKSTGVKGSFPDFEEFLRYN